MDRYSALYRYTRVGKFIPAGGINWLLRELKLTGINKLVYATYWRHLLAPLTGKDWPMNLSYVICTSLP